MRPGWETSSKSRPHVSRRAALGVLSGATLSVHFGCGSEPPPAKPPVKPPIDLQPDARGRTVLHHAAWQGDVAEVRRLIGAGAPVDVSDKFGWSPLHDALAYGYPNVGELLLQAGAHADLEDVTGRTPVMWVPSRVGYDYLVARQVPMDAFSAARFGDVERLNAALSAEPNAAKAKTRDGETPLHFACRGASHAAAQLLLERGADPNARDAAGMSALQVSAMQTDPATSAEHAALRKTLVERGAVVDLRAAILLGEADRAYALASQSAPALLERDAFGFQPVHWALAFDRKDFAKFLVPPQGSDAFVAAGLGHVEWLESILAAHPDAANMGIGEPRCYSDRRSNRGGADLVLGRQADPNSKLGSMTPLFWAVRNGQVDAVMLLLDSQTDVKAVDSYGRTALFAAIESASPDILKFLFDAGIDVNAQDTSRGETALHHAMHVGASPDVVRALADHGADPKLADVWGRGPLFFAHAAPAESVEILLARGAPTKEKSKFDALPIDVFRRMQSPHVALLERWMAK